MKRNLLMTATTVFAVSLLPAQAETKDDVKNAIQKLSESASYSWTSTSKRPDGAEDRGGSGATNGKTAEGLVYLSSTRGERTSETLLKDKKVVVKRDEGWSLVEPRPSGDAAPEQGQRRGRNFGRNYDDFKAPAAQAAELLEKVGELKKDGDVYVGELTEEGAKSLLSFGGGGRRGGGDGAQRPAPTDVKASAKFWVVDGVLAKYETSLKGSISFNGNDRDLSRDTTVEIKDVGSTKIEVPEEAKTKLESK
jgi:hypothetical protein